MAGGKEDETMEKVLTMVEREELEERIAIARCVVKNGRLPTKSELSQERQAMRFDQQHGKTAVPETTIQEARAFLTGLHVLVPQPAAPAPVSGPRQGTVPAPKTNYPDNGKLPDSARK